MEWKVPGYKWNSVLPSLSQGDICDAYLCGQDVFCEQKGTWATRKEGNEIGDLGEDRIIISKYLFFCFQPYAVGNIHWCSE